MALYSTTLSTHIDALPNDFALSDMYRFLKMFLTIILLTPRISPFSMPPPQQSLSFLLYLRTHLYPLLPLYHLLHLFNKSLSLPPCLWMYLLLLLIFHLCLLQLL